MKNIVKYVARCLLVLFILSAFYVAPVVIGCSRNEFVLNEKTFFKVMTNIQYYPETYEEKYIEFDCFTYAITDVESGKEYICGVRKCSSGYGCNCGQDTVIGFILDYDGEIPAPKNQSVDGAEKTWIHVRGKLSSATKTGVKVYAYENGAVTDRKETIEFLTFNAETLSLVEDASNLNYYVTK